MVDAGGAIDVEKTPATPAEVAVATLLTLERDGKKFHELREHAREILAAASEAPSSSGGVPAFVVRCIELVLTTRRRLRRRRESDDAKREGDECDGDASAEDLALGGADPMVHLLLECAPRVSGAGASRETVDSKTLAGGDARARRQRYVDRGDRHAAVPLLTRAMAAGAADRATTSVVAVDASLGALEPRAVIRLAETYGLDFDDVVDALAPGGATAADVRELMNAYVDALFEAGRHAPATRLIVFFRLETRATRDAIDALVLASQFDLAAELAEATAGHASPSRDLRRAVVDACARLDEHAGRRAAWLAVEHFSLHAEYPDARATYFESTIARMIERGQHEAALRYAGEDVALMRYVVERLVETGDVVVASEFAGRAGFDDASWWFNRLSAPELLAAAEARRDAYLRLPESLWESRVVFVDDEAGLRLARERLRGVDVVGIDTEWAAPLNEGGGGGGARTLSGAGKGRKKRGRRRRRRRGRDDGDGDGGSGSGGASAEEGEDDGRFEVEEEEEEEEMDEDAKARSDAEVVALLQIASRDDVFLIDVPAVLKTCPGAITPTLGALLSDTNILKTGFGVAEDLRRLAKLHPEAFGGFVAPGDGDRGGGGGGGGGATRRRGQSVGVGPIVDLQRVWNAGARLAREENDTTRKAREKTHAGAAPRVRGPWSAPEQRRRARDAVGLSHVARVVLGKPLDKSTRMSDWSARPLTERQRHYAALDAWVLVEVMRVLREEHGDELDRLSRG